MVKFVTVVFAVVGAGKTRRDGCHDPVSKEEV